jgi:hypothetical protein
MDIRALAGDDLTTRPDNRSGNDEVRDGNAVSFLF